MKKIVSLIVFLMVLFNFWSCTNQDEEAFEEKKSQEFFKNKKGGNGIVDNDNEDDYEIIEIDCDEEPVFKIYIHYKMDLSISRINQLRSTYLGDWTFANTYTTYSNVIDDDILINENSSKGEIHSNITDLWTYPIPYPYPGYVSECDCCKYYVTMPNASGVKRGELSDEDDIDSFD